MKVNDLVSSTGYTRNILSHFTITIYDVETDDFISIKNPTLDEYVNLCDRKVLEWYPEDLLDDTNNCIVDIYVKMKKTDYETFKSHRSF